MTTQLVYQFYSYLCADADIDANSQTHPRWWWWRRPCQMMRDHFIITTPSRLISSLLFFRSFAASTISCLPVCLSVSREEWSTFRISDCYHCTTCQNENRISEKEKCTGTGIISFFFLFPFSVSQVAFLIDTEIKIKTCLWVLMLLLLLLMDASTIRHFTSLYSTSTPLPLRLLALVVVVIFCLSLSPPFIFGTHPSFYALLLLLLLYACNGRWWHPTTFSLLHLQLDARKTFKIKEPS